MKKLIMLAVFLLAFALAAPAAVNDAATFTVTDSLYYLLSSDGNGTYADWRLSGSDPCVFSWVTTPGLFFAYLYRGNDLGEDCQAEFPGQERTYTLTFPEGTGICAALGLPVENQACSLEADDKPRIAFDKLFSARTTESPGRFMFYLNGRSYQLECVGEVSGSGNTRTVSNTARVAVLKLISGKKPQQIGTPFVFSFEMTVVRVP